MNCTHLRDLLPALIYGDLAPETKAAVEDHLATCTHCCQEHAALADVRQLLDLAPVPRVHVNVPRIYEQARRQQQKKVRRWRRVAGVALSAAAALFVVLALRLEARWEGRQLVLRLGLPPAVDSVPQPKPEIMAEQPPAPLPRPEVTAADLQLVKDLVHNLVAVVEERDGKVAQDLALLEARLNQMQDQARTHWAATQRFVSALQTSQLDPRPKGEK